MNDGASLKDLANLFLDGVPKIATLDDVQQCIDTFYEDVMFSEEAEQLSDDEKADNDNMLTIANVTVELQVLMFYGIQGGRQQELTDFLEG